ncbi:leucine-rich repeat domain-containing protein [Ferruginibacter sp.]
MKGLKKLVINYSLLENIESISELPNLVHLDLTGNKLSDMKPIQKLIKLQHLNLSNNLIEYIFYQDTFKTLKNLNLGNNPIINFEKLSEFMSLEKLYLNGVKLKDITFLSKLLKIVMLDINNNQITDLSPINKLDKLEVLIVLGNRVGALPDLRKLSNLKTINLGQNKIQDIWPLKDLKKLEVLWLLDNKIKDISVLEYLPQLKSLSLGDNGVREIDPIKYLKTLKRLDLQDNLISNITPLKQLTSLTKLSLKSNEISDIDSLKDLKNLEILQLQNNPIKYLPPWITTFDMKITWDEFGWNNKSITFFQNPLISPSVATVKQGKASIARYFAKISKEGLDYIYEAKLTLVGEGSSGKTSLQIRLIKSNGILPKEDKRTRGIKIIDWTFKTIKGKKQIAHIWDFGGQDVYYPVHRFFLTEDSVFVLLASTRQTNHNFDYWIPTIYQFGGKSPILLGQTCHDGNRVTWNDLNYYIGNSNFNIIKSQILPYTELNLLKKNEGLAKIKKEIINQIEKLPHYGKGVPKSWIPLREKISKQPKNSACITFEEFKKICEKSDPIAFKKAIDVEDCAKFFHSIGVMLWYSENEDLKDWVILQPQWAMNAVYKIIDDEEIQKPQRRGTITAIDFKRLWKDSSYVGKQVILKKMLHFFKIAFPKKHKKSDYIIPARLISMPDSNRWKNIEPYLRLEYKFDFMPKGITNQLSAELSRYIVADDEVWNNAVNLVNEDKSALCQIEEDFYNRKIFIKAKGKNARDLVSITKHALKEITDEYKGVQPEIIVPCTCLKCIDNIKPTLFTLSDLLRWSELEESPTVYCNEGREYLFIDKLLHNVGLPKNNRLNEMDASLKKIKAVKVFVSYSKFDENYLEDFQDHLVTLKEEGLISFDCREIEFGKEWNTEIKKQIDECDIMICLVSVKFLNTDYIRKIEVTKAIQQNKIIIPIIIKACDWEGSVLGKYQAAQRGKIVSLDNKLRLQGRIKSYNEEEKAAFWTAIIKEFRKKIFF